MIQIKKWRLVFVCLLTLCACSIIQAQDRTIVISGSVVTPEKDSQQGMGRNQAQEN
jgi:TRAP-type C4-dicarboxylate transport system substrate-binding protein